MSEYELGRQAGRIEGRSDVLISEAGHEAAEAITDAVFHPQLHDINSFTPAALALIGPIRPILLNGIILVGLRFLLGTNLGTGLEIALLILGGLVSLAMFWSPTPSGVAVLWTHDHAKGFAVIFGIVSAAVLTSWCVASGFIPPTSIAKIVCFILLALITPALMVEVFKIPLVGLFGTIFVHLSSLILWIFLMSLLIEETRNIPSLREPAVNFIQIANTTLNSAINYLFN